MPKMTLPTLPTPVPYTDDDLVISYSELDTYRQCPLKWFIAYKNRWTVEERDADSPLAKGSLWHAVMEAHYGVIRAWQLAHGGVAVALKDEGAVLKLARESVIPLLWETTGAQTENQTLIQWMYEGYVERYGADRQWLILEVEYQLAEYLPAPEGGDSEFILKGKLDLIVMDVSTGKIWVIDHKSGANLPSQMDLEIDDQFGLYTWLMQHKGLKIMGAIHSATRTTRNKADFDDYVGNLKAQTLEQRMHRTYLNRGDVETLNIANDAFAVAVNAYPPKGMELPMYSSPDPRQCGWKCDMKEVHLLARAGRPLVMALKERGFVQDFRRH